MARKSPLFHRAHYNIIAAQIREATVDPSAAVTPLQKGRMLLQSGAVTNLALNLARRFQEDNERFDPHKFLDACSPDPERMPLSELWNDE